MTITACANIMIVKGYLLQISNKWLTPYYSRVSYSIPYIGGFINYFFLGIGMDVGGLLIKYSSRSLMIYEIERSFSFASLSRKVFISSVIRKLKDTDFTSFIVVQCTTLFSCISNINILICAMHRSTLRCNT